MHWKAPALVLVLVFAGTLAFPTFRVYAVGATEPRLLWKFQMQNASANNWVYSIASGNLTGDGVAIVVGCINGAEVYAMFKNGTEFWKLGVDGDARSVATGDLNGDGLDDVAVGTSNATLYAVRNDGKVLWSYNSPNCVDASGVCIGDVDGDSKLEVVFGCESPTSTGAIIALRADGTVLWRYQRPSYFQVFMYTPIQIADIDGDGKNEVISGTAGSVCAIRSNGSLLFEYFTLPPNWVVRSVAVADFYGNGRKTIVAGCYDGHVYAIKADGSLLWSYDTGNVYGAVKVAVGDIDGNPGDEVIRTCIDDPKGYFLYSLNGNGTSLEDYHAGSSVRSVAVGDVDGDSVNEVIAGVDFYSDTSVPIQHARISAFRNDTGEPIWNFSAGIDMNIFDLKLADLTGDGVSDVVFGTNGGCVAALSACMHHDIAMNVSPKTVVGLGYCLDVSLTAANQGDYPETCNVTVYVNNIKVETQPVMLETGTSTTITFTWNTTGLAYGNWTINVCAEPVLNETYVADNNVTWTVHVGVPGDISGPTQGVYDGKCDMRDVSYLIIRFNSKPDSATWNPNADINNDATVNMRDISTAILNFNKHE